MKAWETVNDDSVRMTHKEFKRKYLGEWVTSPCDVSDSNGRHCQDKPEHFFKYSGRQVGLCRRCYEAYLQGRYRMKINKDRCVLELK